MQRSELPQSFDLIAVKVNLESITSHSAFFSKHVEYKGNSGKIAGASECC